MPFGRTTSQPSSSTDPAQHRRRTPPLELDENPMTSDEIPAGTLALANTAKRHEQADPGPGWRPARHPGPDEARARLLPFVTITLIVTNALIQEVHHESLGYLRTRSSRRQGFPRILPN